MKKRRLIFAFFIFALFLLFSSEAKAQKSDLEAGLMNIGLGSVIGGVGAVINKEPEEKLLPALLKGAGSGALGGYLIFESKRLVRLFAENQSYGYVWPSKIIGSAGSSIIENAAGNRDLWERWHMHIGFNRIELTTGEELKVRYRIMPMALTATIVTATNGDFDWEKSLKTGHFIFTTDQISSEPSEGAITYGQVPLFSNSILILDNWEGDAALAHELVHIYQNESFVGINSFLNEPLKKLIGKKKFFRFYSKIFYTDFHSAVIAGLYNLESWQKGYSGNIFEEEAFYFAGRELKNPTPPKLFGRSN